MTYLCRKYSWDDVYPADNQVRGQVEWYLHYHHRNVRDASTGLVAPMVRKDLNIPEIMQQSARRTLENALRTLENGQLSKHRFIVGDSVTIADLAAYVEIGQLRPEFTNLFDFADYPLIKRWLDDMTGIKGHDASHVVMKEMGDISKEAPTMERIINANKLAMAALAG
ncbi:MAG: glutathione S-transferase C-terminal domain-containing protein, partial [Pseudomonadales bacterium]|nr:glutathione S-transferase C-terminal domain-containing protein [Pseudomonadales bacterium]